MPSIPAQDLRSNVATWSVLHELVPGIVSRMLALMPAESYDPQFIGQLLETTYFDTAKFALRAARKRGDRYLTLRVRRYFPSNSCALSAKTESGKFRVVLPLADLAKDIIESGMYAGAFQSILPADLLARLFELAGDELLQPVTTLRFRRFAVEDADNRLTLDLAIESDAGKRLPYEVLEHKASSPDAAPLNICPTLGLRPIKLSKFLWATRS